MSYGLIRPLLFKIPPENAHHLASLGIRVGMGPRFVRGLVANRLRVEDPALVVDRFGIRFPNPVGLAAGFDKAGTMFNALGALGFGFVEIGTVTALGQPGNPRPRLFRLPADRALLNRMGFNNPGAEAVARRLAEARIEPVLGINLGKSKVTPLENAPEDYLKSLDLLEFFAAYLVVNVSSPNTPGLRQLQDAEPLRQLLTTLRDRVAQLAAKRGTQPKPILLKIAPDLTDSQLEDVVGVATAAGVAGLIATNTTISRDGLRTPAREVEGLGAGGISGAPLRRRALEVVSRLYALTRGQLPIVGVGGIFTADDAWRIILAGASLVQVYTGFVYEGPGIVARINRGLLERLRAYGLKNIDAAVGLAHRDPVLCGRHGDLPQSA